MLDPVRFESLRSIVVPPVDGLVTVEMVDEPTLCAVRGRTAALGCTGCGVRISLPVPVVVRVPVATFTCDVALLVPELVEVVGTVPLPLPDVAGAVEVVEVVAGGGFE